MSDIYGFFHIFNNISHHNKNVTPSIDIVKEITNAINASNLDKFTTKIFSCILGPKSEEINDLLHQNNIEILEEDNDRFKYEQITLNHLFNFCKSKQNNCKIFYVHTKAACNPKRTSLRSDLIKCNITKWETAVKLLDEYDVCGPKLRLDNKYPPHFANNFWWANSKYVKTLNPLKSPKKPNDRFVAEMWICNRGRNNVRMAIIE